jgi:hypothetical protein
MMANGAFRALIDWRVFLDGQALQLRALGCSEDEAHKRLREACSIARACPTRSARDVIRGEVRKVAMGA